MALKWTLLIQKSFQTDRLNLKLSLRDISNRRNHPLSVSIPQICQVYKPLQCTFICGSITQLSNELLVSRPNTSMALVGKRGTYQKPWCCFRIFNICTGLVQSDQKFWSYYMMKPELSGSHVELMWIFHLRFHHILVRVYQCGKIKWPEISVHWTRIFTFVQERSFVWMLTNKISLIFRKWLNFDRIFVNFISSFGLLRTFCKR